LPLQFAIYGKSFEPSYILAGCPHKFMVQPNTVTR
jgi:hypothetical protein